MYKTIETISGQAIVRMTDNAYIPVDEHNSDYQNYIEWLAAGNTPEQYVESPSIPQTLTMRQARLALLDAGKLSSVDAAIDNLPSPQKERAQIEWEFSNEVQRTNGVVSAIGPLIGLSETDIDALFVAGAAL